MRENVIFDIGGVILHWDPEAVIRSVIDDAETRAVVRRDVFQHPDWIDTDRGTLSLVDATDRWAERTRLPRETIAALVEASTTSLAAKPDTLELMRELRGQGRSLYCLSNMPAERFERLLEMYDFWDLFAGIVISGDVGLVKPDPAIYRHLLATHGLDPTTCAFLDDRADNVEAASALGIRGLLFTNAAGARAAGL